MKCIKKCKYTPRQDEIQNWISPCQAGSHLKCGIGTKSPGIVIVHLYMYVCIYVYVYKQKL